ncbi:MAG: hypothetical protein ACO1SV_22800 [Fimbriimonas sp.]
MSLAALAVLVSAAPAEPPRWLDRSLAGYVLAFDEKHGQAGIHDPKRGFYLVRGAECDGSHVSLILTRDRKEVNQWGYKVPSLVDTQGYLPLRERPLPSLATGKGIQIGDTVAVLQKRLGRPTRVERSGDRRQFTSYVYFWRDVVDGEGEEVTNTYVFKGGRLIEISFHRDSVPGC